MIFAEIFLFFITLALAFYYAYLISDIYDGWEKTEETFVQKPVKNYHHFTILIPARNEVQNIESCLSSIQNLNYPSSFIRVIVIDDHSSDDTKKIVKQFKTVDLLNNSGAGKKDAIYTGVKAAKSDYIITIDADCMVHPDLVLLYNEKLTNNSDLHFIAGGVIFAERKSVIGWFQSLDILSLMASTAFGIHSGNFYLANGANMCFKRDTFLNLKSYEGDRNISSGDDVFLINKIVSSLSGEAVSFLKSKRGAVITQPENTFQDLAKQRFRWASKTQDYANFHLLRLQSSVFCIHIFALILFVLAYWFPLSAFYLVLLLLVKAAIDYMFLHRMASFYQIKWSIPGFISTTLIYYPYIFYMAFAALVKGSYVWKGRKLR